MKETSVAYAHHYGMGTIASDHMGMGTATRIYCTSLRTESDRENRYYIQDTDSLSSLVSRELHMSWGLIQQVGHGPYG